MNPVRNLEKKMDRCVRLLEELNSQVRDLRRQNLEQQKVCAETVRQIAAEELAQAGKPETVQAEAPAPAKVNTPENITEEAKTEDIPAVVKQEKTPEFTEIADMVAKRAFNMDKYGRVYTEEEIESLISD